MTHSPRSVLFLLAGIFFSVVSRGQSVFLQVTSSAGDSFKNSSYAVDWTLGEFETATLTSANTVLTQGFQQPMQPIIIGAEEPAASISIYPNPVTDFLVIESPYQKNVHASTSTVVILSDITGRALVNQEMNNIPHTIDFRAFSAGVYILTVTSGLNSKKVYSIIKL